MYELQSANALTFALLTKDVKDRRHRELQNNDRKIMTQKNRSVAVVHMWLSRFSVLSTQPHCGFEGRPFRETAPILRIAYIRHCCQLIRDIQPAKTRGAE